VALTDRPRVVVLRALGLGDLLASVPALRGVRRALPGHELVLAAPRALEPLVDLVGAVDRVHDHRGLAPLAGLAGTPTIAVNLHGRGPESHRLLRATGARRLVAFGCPEAGHPGPEWDVDEHEVVRWCRLVSEGLDADVDPSDLQLSPPRVPSPVAAGAVVVHPGAAFGARRWPADRFGAVARTLADRGHHVVVTGGADEVELGLTVAALAGLPAESVLAGSTDLAQLAAAVAGASLVVSGDTGVAHLASAFATPSVVLFGPTSPSRWGPPPDGPHRVIWHGTGDGDPWSGRIDPALARVAVEEVLQAVEATLGAEVIRGPAPRTTPESA
jgi:ADP-heptose:LPS heptosyltransferase